MCFTRLHWLHLYLIRFNMGFIALYQVLDALVVSHGFIGVNFRSHSLTVLRSAYVRVLRIHNSRGHLQTRKDPRFVGNKTNRLGLTLPYQLPITYVRIVGGHISNAPQLYAARHRHTFLTHSTFRQRLTRANGRGTQLTLSNGGFSSFEECFDNFDHGFGASGRCF